ncbi:unnamed protein product [Rhizophagus irregularis]|nr:unnamed protein product [Rhizophagus irregularis]
MIVNRRKFLNCYYENNLLFTNYETFKLGSNSTILNFCRFCFKLIIINSPNSEETRITCRKILIKNLEPNTRTIRFEMLTKVFILLKKYQCKWIKD